jgi:hypothetical protein
VKETIGPLTGDVATRLEAETGEDRDKAQQLYADATELARDALSSKGLAVLGHGGDRLRARSDGAAARAEVNAARRVQRVR